MNTLHDLSNTEYLEHFRAPIDMAEVARLATLRRWKLDFECGGKPYTWTDTAENQTEAENMARASLYITQPDFCEHTARLVACIEVAA